jgi:hypothetical protein
LSLFVGYVGCVEKVGEENEVGKVQHHAEYDIVLRLVTKDAILHLNLSVDGNKASNDHLDYLKGRYCHHDPF